MSKKIFSVDDYEFSSAFHTALRKAVNGKWSGIAYNAYFLLSPDECVGFASILRGKFIENGKITVDDAVDSIDELLEKSPTRTPALILFSIGIDMARSVGEKHQFAEISDFISNFISNQ